MIYPTALVDPTVKVPATYQIWHLAQVREGVQLGEHAKIGRGSYIGSGVYIGAFTKIQNFAQVFEPASLGTGVFIGPGAVLTNDRNPRAIHPDGAPKMPDDWSAVGVVVHDGASIGANATCIAPIEIGRWAMVAAGSVVTKDVRAYALVAGNPAEQIGWVGSSGYKLEPGPLSGQFVCPASGEVYSASHEGGIAPLVGDC